MPSVRLPSAPPPLAVLPALKTGLGLWAHHHGGLGLCLLKSGSAWDEAVTHLPRVGPRNHTASLTRSGRKNHPGVLFTCRFRFGRSGAEPEILHFQRVPRRGCAIEKISKQTLYQAFHRLDAVLCASLASSPLILPIPPTLSTTIIPIYCRGKRGTAR